MISIRDRLLTTIFCVLMICTALIAVLTYTSSHEEIFEIFDENMQQVALVVSVHEYQGHQYQGSKDPDLTGDDEFLIQVWDQDQLVFTSHPLVEFPLQEKAGFEDVPFRGETWRYYQHKRGEKRVQVAQSLDKRDETTIDISLQFIIPIFVQLPIMLALVYMMIGQGLKPLRSISEKVKQRGAHNLSLIEEDDAPQEIFPLIQSVNQLLRRLDDSLRVQRRFTADAAHELRTPLTAVQLQLDILERAEEGKERLESQSKLRSGVERSIALVKSLLLLARHEPESFSAGRENVDLAAVVKKIFNDLRPMAEEANLDYVLKNNARKSDVRGQTENLCTLTENLIQNALLYSNEGGTIEVSLESDKKHVILSVSDDGPGIPEQERDRVFDRFYRILGTKKAGSGLGLSIVKNIIEYCDGTITIEDGLNGRGCRFIVKFPFV